MGKVTVNKRKIPKGKTQVNFNISDQVLEKVKKLAYWENVTHSEVFNKSVVRFLELYEEKNGKIKPIPPAKGLDNV